ncbi:MAG: energy-coupling factor ABC transporter ATP-binding protein [Planctomycetota bacterium]
MTARILEFDRVSAAYPGGSPALRNVSFTIRDANARTAVLGGNGAGKSSLFLALGGFLKFDGAIHVEGKLLTMASIEQIRRSIGFVFENADDQFFLETLFDDIAFGPRNAGVAESDITNRVREALAAVGLEGCESRHPRKLSLGERRLASIATVLSMRPRILIFDEPTANLDLRARRRVLTTIRNFNGAVIVLTHDLAAAREITNEAVVLSEGCVVFTGTTTDVFRHPAARAALSIDAEESMIEKLF